MTARTMFLGVCLSLLVGTILVVDGMKDPLTINIDGESWDCESHQISQCGVHVNGCSKRSFPVVRSFRCLTNLEIAP